MPTTRFSLKISRVHSMSSFSWKGSPTWTAGRLAGLGVVEGLGGQHGDAADAVAAGAGAEQDDLVARAGGLGQVDVLVPHDADGSRR